MHSNLYFCHILFYSSSEPELYTQIHSLCKVTIEWNHPRISDGSVTNATLYVPRDTDLVVFCRSQFFCQELCFKVSLFNLHFLCWSPSLVVLALFSRDNNVFCVCKQLLGLILAIFFTSFTKLVSSISKNSKGPF